MGLGQVFRDLWAAWRTHYPFTLIVVVVGFGFSAIAYLAHRISGPEFVLLAGFFALLGPLMIVARELRGSGLGNPDRAG